ncbi:hypothetical protein HMPREF2909_02350 [Alloscardovia sp. HMSC034E08]|nr:hypothetical protein HMPREF2909_02350 [Alloscardovia sp. HMSC034E08]
MDKKAGLGLFWWEPAWLPETKPQPAEPWAHPVDKSALTAALEKAKAVDPSAYEEAGLDTLAIVRAHAQRVLDYKDAAGRDVNQSSVDVATRQPMNAVNALVALPGEEKPEPPEKPVNPGTSNNGNSQNGDTQTNTSQNNNQKNNSNQCTKAPAQGAATHVAGKSAKGIKLAATGSSVVPTLVCGCSCSCVCSSAIYPKANA